MSFEELSESFLSKDIQVQQNGLEKVKKMVVEFNNSNEYFLISIISNLLEFGSDKKFQGEVENICNLFVQNVNPYSFEFVFNEISKIFSTVKFQSKILGLKMIETYANMHPQVVSSNLPIIIESLINLSSDVKKDVKVAVQECWSSICKTIKNVDIQPIIPVMIEGYMNPSTKTEYALEKLASTPLVNDIDIPTLGLLIPMLVRAMREKKVVCQRKAAVVMDTLCKLIKNPVYARIFYDKLMWILDKGINEIAVEEVRNVCKRSKLTLNGVYEQANTKLVDAVTEESCFQLYKEYIEKDLNEHINIINYTIKLVLNLVKYEIREELPYRKCIEPYIRDIILEEKERFDIVDKISRKLIDTITVYEYDPEENDENLCDCMFSLAYGTRVLLHQTPLKLKLNHIYGILGHNGAGKSTLLRAMANKTLQGFPDIEATYIEHHIPEELHDMIT
jgi:elongation factor 3